MLQRTPGRTGRRQVPIEPRQADSSDDDSHPGLAIEIAPPPPVIAEPDVEADVTSSDRGSDGSIADESGTDDELSVGPVRRSTRSTAGRHSNRYHLPMSVRKK